MCVALGAVAALLGMACATTRPAHGPEPSLVWVRGDRAYVAAPDSLVLEPGDLLAFVSRGDTVATGTVARIHEDDLAVVRLATGSLGARRFDRVRVIASPATRRPLPKLSVGLPSPRRRNLLFACNERVTSVSAPGGYDYKALDRSTRQLVRNPGFRLEAWWPDTLIMRTFDEVADEEIALERGELDVAVFWPGELPQRMRASPRWGGHAWGTRSRGVVLARWIEPEDSSAGRPELSLGPMNHDLFGGDLAPWPGSDRAPVRLSIDVLEPVRFVAEAAWPGRVTIERYLDQNSGGDGRRVDLVLADVPTAAPESLALWVTDRLTSSVPASWAHARADTLRAAIRRASEVGESFTHARVLRGLEDLGVTPLFTIRCPVVCEPALRHRVSRLADALANLIDCPSSGR